MYINHVAQVSDTAQVTAFLMYEVNLPTFGHYLIPNSMFLVALFSRNYCF